MGQEKKKFSKGKQWNRVSGNTHIEKYKQTNAKFALEDKAFRAACTQAEVEPTTRQASKFRNNQGSAYKGLHNIL
jgi:hypothetical protein